MIKSINDPVDVRNCSTMMELATLLRTKYTEGYTVGRAPCGSNQSNNFREIVTTCPIGSYVTASVRLVLWSDETIAMEVVAVSQLSTVTSVAHKYLWLQGSGRVPVQSDWILTAQRT